MTIKLLDGYAGVSNLSDVRDQTMIILSYAEFLRFDEISKLHTNDVQFEESHLVLKIRRSKTDKFRAGNKVYISKSKASACAYSFWDVTLIST